ncbi:hypothetical protein BGX24_006416 [Mortierella sp. AD032]|nr:hypothetical protein BGX24_006416 [Mortierella sp. AD032]
MSTLQRPELNDCTQLFDRSTYLQAVRLQLFVYKSCIFFHADIQTQELQFWQRSKLMDEFVNPAIQS